MYTSNKHNALALISSARKVKKELSFSLTFHLILWKPKIIQVSFTSQLYWYLPLNYCYSSNLRQIIWRTGKNIKYWAIACWRNFHYGLSLMRQKFLWKIKYDGLLKDYVRANPPMVPPHFWRILASILSFANKNEFEYISICNSYYLSLLRLSFWTSMGQWALNKASRC